MYVCMWVWVCVCVCVYTCTLAIAIGSYIVLGKGLPCRSPRLAK